MTTKKEITVFHGTSLKAARAIMKEGFKVKKEATVLGDQPPYCFGAASVGDCLPFAKWAGKRHGDGWMVVLKVVLKREPVWAYPEEIFGIHIQGEPINALFKPEWVESVEIVFAKPILPNMRIEDDREDEEALWDWFNFDLSHNAIKHFLYEKKEAKK